MIINIKLCFLSDNFHIYIMYNEYVIHYVFISDLGQLDYALGS